MKKLLIIIAVLLSANSIYAQQKARLGFKTGLNFPSLQPRTPYSPGADYKISAKFHAGLFAEFKAGKYTVQPGLIFSVKGNKAVQDSNTISFGKPVPLTVERNVNIYYLEVPVNVLYQRPVKLGTFYAGGGPYAAYGIGGRIRSINKRNTYMKKGSVQQVEFGDASNELKAFDYGLNATTGLRLKNSMDLGATLGFGLANISNNSAYKSFNRLVNVHIGYWF